MRMCYARAGQFAAKLLLALVLQCAVACLLLADTTAGYSTLQDWIRRSALTFSPNSPTATDAVVDNFVALLGWRVVRQMGIP